MTLLNLNVRMIAGALLSHDAIRFLGVGVWNVLFSTVCFAVLLKFVFHGTHYMLVLVVSTILSVTNSFICHRWFTFRSDAPILKAYLKFYLVYGVQIGLTFILMPVCVELLKWRPIMAQISVTFFTTVITYFGHKYFSFQSDSFMMSRTMVKTSVLRRWPMLSLGAILITSFALGYLFCFVRPVFLNPAQEMAFPRYISAINPIGVDLRLAYDFSKSWIMGTTPEIPSLVYPPLERVLRLPLLVFPFRGAFVIQTLITLIAFMSVVLLLPKRFSKSPDWTALSGLFLAGLFSYGMQFEIERGQSNVIAMALVAWALVLFHYGRGASARLAAYLLFSCAIQLKLYPAVFVLGFTTDARDWRRNIVRWGGIGVANAAGLFALGWDAFCVFLSTLTKHSGGYVSFGNHSLLSFASVVQKLADGYKPRYYHLEEVAAAGDCIRSVLPEAWLQILGPTVGLSFALILLGCLTAVLAMAYRRNDRTAFKYVMVMCSFVALLIPGVSMDYKLTVLIVVFAFFVSESEPIVLTGKRGMLRAGLFFAGCLLVTLTLFPPEFRPFVLRSSTPLLLSIAVLFTVLMALERRSASGKEDSPADLHE